jgi:hypothetical protein
MAPLSSAAEAEIGPNQRNETKSHCLCHFCEVQNSSQNFVKDPSTGFNNKKKQKM